MKPPTGIVYLIGAGPGDPRLITVRGRELLRAADIIIHDRLVAPELLAEARPAAQVIDAGKTPGSPHHSQHWINQTLIRHALQGALVVRLKGGDPFVFGRGAEELAACRAAGIPCIVVPGISSALAAPAAAGIPVTHRGLARSFAVVTAQICDSPSGTASQPPIRGAGFPPESADSRAHSENCAAAGQPASSPINWQALRSIDTLVILMGRSTLADTISKLIASGWPPQTPAACIQSATTSAQQSVAATLDTILPAVESAALSAPMVFVVGPTAALALRDNPSHGFASSEIAAALPLLNRRILITRETRSARRLRRALEAAGAIVIQAPLIEISYPRSSPSLDAVIPRLSAYDYITFTSAHAVIAFLRQLARANLDARTLADSRIAAIGPATARALKRRGLRPDLIPAESTGRALADAILQSLPPLAAAPATPTRILHPSGNLARSDLRARLTAAGCTVDEPIIYNTRPAAPSPQALDILRHGFDAILFHSPSAVDSFVKLNLHEPSTCIACIGPTTAAAARDAGLNVAIIPDQAGDASFVVALENYFSRTQNHAAFAAHLGAS